MRVGSDARPPFEVVLERSAAAEDVERVRHAFERWGMRAEVKASLEFKSAEGQSIVSTLLVVPLAAFLAAFAAEAGRDAYRKLKNFVTDITSRSSGGSSVLWIQDGSNGLDIVLDRDLPDEAYVAVFDLDLDGIPPHATIRFDRSQGVWMHYFGQKPVPLRKART